MSLSAKQILFSFFCGGLASLALPPFGYLACALALAGPVLLAVRSARPIKGAVFFGVGAFGWFSASLYWIGSALFVKGGVHLFLLPLACLGLPFLLALFWGLAAYCALKLSPHIASRLVLLAGFWGIAEAVRSVIFTGFPWNVTGHIFIETLVLAQSAAFIGQDGINLLATIFITVAASLYLRYLKLSVLLSLPVWIGLILGITHLNEAPPLRAETSIIRLVQPNIPQSEKWIPERKSAHFEKMIELANSPEKQAALTILPEAAIAGFWRDDKEEVEKMAARITPQDGILLTGILASNAENQFFNSAFFIHHSGGLLGRYDKQHLVPFGETIPFREIPFIDAIAGKGEFTHGKKAEPIFIEPFGHIRVLICYEIIFPDFIAKDNVRPDMLITISNDAWFGQTSGPYQHFFQSRLRAIEEGIPVYRLANTGISGSFDAFGRLIARTELGKSAVLDVPHLQAIAPTFYAKNRQLGALFLLLYLASLAIFLEIAFRKRNNDRFKNP